MRAASKSSLPLPFLTAARRIDVGGKHLTNYLMELVSYRALDLSSEPCVVEAMKEDVCFVAPTPAAALQRPAVDYVLPDFGAVQRGRRLAPGETTALQTVRVAGERCWVPELLFSPAIVGTCLRTCRVFTEGIPQMGVLECAEESVSATPLGSHAATCVMARCSRVAVQ